MMNEIVGPLLFAFATVYSICRGARNFIAVGTFSRQGSGRRGARIGLTFSGVMDVFIAAGIASVLFVPTGAVMRITVGVLAGMFAERGNTAYWRRGMSSEAGEGFWR